jgi:hypothetical protein
MSKRARSIVAKALIQNELDVKGMTLLELKRAKRMIELEINGRVKERAALYKRETLDDLRKKLGDEFSDLSILDVIHTGSAVSIFGPDWVIFIHRDKFRVTWANVYEAKCEGSKVQIVRNELAAEDARLPNVQKVVRAAHHLKDAYSS